VRPHILAAMRKPTPGALVALSLLVLAACDARATTSAAPSRVDLKSRELESCGATMDCQDGLRCFDHMCRRTDRSLQGDFQAALAQRAEASGDLEAALSAYAESIARYGADNLKTPVEIDCAYGRALAKGKANRERAELAARVLHRCLQATPVGAPLRAMTLANLADLAELGLDPAHLSATEAADVFLSKAPAVPTAAKVTVGVSAEPIPTGKSWPVVSARLGGTDLRPALVKCWEAYYAATRTPQLAVSMGLKARYVPDEEYDDEGRWSVSIDETKGLSGPDAAADSCVRAVVEPILKKAEGVRDSFATRLTLTIQ
jgi:hypothetical protein